jgi:hypothetical protein
MRAEFGLAAVAMIERVDLRRIWTVPADLDHLLDHISRPREDSLDRSVTAIAHPAA